MIKTNEYTPMTIFENCFTLNLKGKSQISNPSDFLQNFPTVVNVSKKSLENVTDRDPQKLTPIPAFFRNKNVHTCSLHLLTFANTT